MRFAGMLGLVTLLLFAPPALGADAGASGPKLITSNGIALYGDPKYGPDYKHFDYVNPDAPKGGTVKFTQQGSYDSFNPFAIRGVSAINILNLTLVYDRLMEPSFDELQSQYGMLAETLTYPDNYAWVEYKLRKNARWQDGTPVTPQDVVFTYNQVKDGASTFSAFVKDVAKAEITGPRSVRFTFKEAGNKRSLISIGLLAVVPEHYWKGKDFLAPSVVPPLASGPYKVTSYELGRSFTLTRDPNYWGKDVPVNVGRFNYGKIVTDFFRDDVAAFEGFKVGDSDVRFESSPKAWATEYDFPALKQGHVLKDVIHLKSGFQLEAYFFNIRRNKFKDPVLREALAYAFDFNWMNKNLFYGSQERIESYFGFQGSELAESGLPSQAELALLDPYKSQIPARVFTTPFQLPDTDGTDAGLRKNLSIAAKMLANARYRIKNGVLTYPRSTTPVAFEVMMANPGYQLATSHWAENLKLLGITVSMRVVDQAQLIAREQSRDFDVAATLIPMGPLPGTEQRNIWGSAAADNNSTFAVVGVKSPAVDALIEKLAGAQTMDELLAATHALDRVLSWSYYSIPLYSNGGALDVAYWNRLGRPSPEQPFGWPWLNTWWIDSQKDAALRNTVHLER